MWKEKEGANYTSSNFDDIGKLEDANMNWIIHKSLSKVDELYSFCINDLTKRQFIMAVQSLYQITRYYWLYDRGFKQSIIDIESEKQNKLKRIPRGLNSNPGSGETRLDIEFEIAELKYERIIEVITTSSKAYPFSDQLVKLPDKEIEGEDEIIEGEGR